MKKKIIEARVLHNNEDKNKNSHNKDFFFLNDMTKKKERDREEMKNIQIFVGWCLI